MLKRVKNAVFMLSTALLILVVVVWVRSYFVANFRLHSSWRHEGGYSYWTMDCVQIGRGGVGYNRVVQSGKATRFKRSMALMTHGRSDRHDWYPYPLALQYPNFHFRTNDDAKHGFAADYFEHRDTGGRLAGYGYELVVPIWLIALLLSIAPLWRLWRWQRARRRVAENLCPVCGYDLRATPERCPECGTAAVAPAG